LSWGTIEHHAERLSRIVWFGACFTLSLAAFAALNAHEKKATKEAQIIANEAVDRVKKACGNSSLKFVFEWQAFKELDYTVGGISRDEAMRRAGDRANRVGNAMIAVCSDPAKKLALSQIREVHLAPQDEAKNFFFEFARQGDLLQIKFGAFGVIATQDLTAEIKKLF
jgi:hypothetical protein